MQPRLIKLAVNSFGRMTLAFAGGLFAFGSFAVSAPAKTAGATAAELANIGPSLKNRQADINWIDQQFHAAIEKMAKKRAEADREQIILKLATEINQRSIPKDSTELAIEEANYFVNYQVAIEPLADQAKQHKLDPFYCPDIRQNVRRTDIAAQREIADGTVIYLPETLEVLKVVDVLCPKRAE